MLPQASHSNHYLLVNVSTLPNHHFIINLNDILDLLMFSEKLERSIEKLKSKDDGQRIGATPVKTSHLQQAATGMEYQPEP